MSEPLPLHVYPDEGDRYYDASMDVWYVIRDGEWVHDPPHDWALLQHLASENPNWSELRRLLPENPNTPGPIPQGDQAGRASAPGGRGAIMSDHVHTLKTCSDCDGAGFNRWDGPCPSCDTRGYVEYCSACGEPMGNRRRKWKRSQRPRSGASAHQRT